MQWTLEQNKTIAIGLFLEKFNKKTKKLKKIKNQQKWMSTILHTLTHQKNTILQKERILSNSRTWLLILESNIGSENVIGTFTPPFYLQVLPFKGWTIFFVQGFFIRNCIFRMVDCCNWSFLKSSRIFRSFCGFGMVFRVDLVAVCPSFRVLCNYFEIGFCDGFWVDFMDEGWLV